jgi:hypothetical protein
MVMMFDYVRLGSLDDLLSWGRVHLGLELKVPRNPRCYGFRRGGARRICNSRWSLETFEGVAHYYCLVLE